MLFQGKRGANQSVWSTGCRHRSALGYNNNEAVIKTRENLFAHDNFGYRHDGGRIFGAKQTLHSSMDGRNVTILEIRLI